MAHSPIIQVTLFRIGMKHDWPCYKYQDRLEVKDGAHQELVTDFIRSRRGRTPYPQRYQGYPERDLDIYESETGGTCVYLFELDVRGLKNKYVEFPRQGPRFVEFPVEFPRKETFLTEIKSYDEGNGRWAAFACDLKALRKSDLARRVRERGGLHSHALNIPFYFNFVDQVLEAAPWVIPDHFRLKHASRPSHRSDHSPGSDDPEHEDHEGHEEHDHHRTEPPTHGGVHPKPLAFLSVSLEE